MYCAGIIQLALSVYLGNSRLWIIFRILNLCVECIEPKKNKEDELTNKVVFPVKIRQAIICYAQPFPTNISRHLFLHE